jgi:hypothetical protein
VLLYGRGDAYRTGFGEELNHDLFASLYEMIKDLFIRK